MTHASIVVIENPNPQGEDTRLYVDDIGERVLNPSEEFVLCERPGCGHVLDVDGQSCPDKCPHKFHWGDPELRKQEWLASVLR